MAVGAGVGRARPRFLRGFAGSLGGSGARLGPGRRHRTGGSDPRRSRGGPRRPRSQSGRDRRRPSPLEEAKSRSHLRRSDSISTRPPWSRRAMEVGRQGNLVSQFWWWLTHLFSTHASRRHRPDRRRRGRSGDDDLGHRGDRQPAVPGWSRNQRNGARRRSIRGPASKSIARSRPDLILEQSIDIRPDGHGSPGRHRPTRLDQPRTSTRRCEAPNSSWRGRSPFETPSAKGRSLSR